MIQLLPKWINESDHPSFYDAESVTALEATAKLHGKMLQLIEMYNEMVDEANKKIEEFINDTNADHNEFEVAMRQEFQDFIDIVDTAIKKIENDLLSHNETRNPHNVTAEDVGTYTKNEIDTALSEVGEKLEYINTITFAEDGRLAQIDTDHNGNPFELKKFVMFGRNLPSVSTTVTSGVVYVLATLLPDVEFEANGQYNLCSNGALSSSLTNNWGAYYEVVAVEPDANRDDGKIAVIRGMKSPTNPFISGVPDGCNGFVRLGVCTSSTKALFGAGSTIDIYGVRV